MLKNRLKWWVNFKVQKPEKAQLGTLEMMYKMHVQYDHNRHTSFWDLLWKQSVSKRLNRS